MNGPHSFAAAERALRVLDIAVRHRLDGFVAGEHTGRRLSDRVVSRMQPALTSRARTTSGGWTGR